jgi:hypothetical protein
MYDPKSIQAHSKESCLTIVEFVIVRQKPGWRFSPSRGPELLGELGLSN